MDWWLLLLGVLGVAKSIALNLVIARLVGFVFTLCRLHVLVKRRLATQGIRGPQPSWLTGNAAEWRRLGGSSRLAEMQDISHDFAHLLLPFHHKYTKIYGRRFLGWSVGWEPFVSTSEPVLVHEALNSPAFEKSGIQNTFMMPLFGRGLIMATGKQWHHQRKLLTPAFYVEKIKGFVPVINFCASGMIQDLKRSIRESNSSVAEIEMHSVLNSVAADVIARTAFGHDFQHRQEFVRLEQELERLVMQQPLFCLIPGYRYLPTKRNRKMWEITKRIRTLLFDLMESRLSTCEDATGDDAFGLLLASASSPPPFSPKKRLTISKDVLVDECKSLYFAGHETTAALLTWSMMLLAINPEWQSKARSEVREILDGNELVTHEMLPKLRIVGNILAETLRLYPAAVSIRRKATQDVELGSDLKKLVIPSGVCVEIPILRIHHDKQIWGDNACEFDPDRFSVTPAAGSYLPFGWGARICIGRNFALAEAKVVLAALLDAFEWEMAPGYRHAPQSGATVYPKHGMQLLLRSSSPEVH